MGGLMSRNKGKRGEREVIGILQPIINEERAALGLPPVVIKRNLMQSYSSGGQDIVGVPWLALEVKYQENTQVDKWWQQAVDQAKPGQEPVLIYRGNHQSWRVVLYAYLTTGLGRVRAMVNVNLETFIAYFRLRIKENLANQE